MSKNVSVPQALLKRIVVLLEYWDISLFDRAVRDEYWVIFWSLKGKLLNLDLREAYARIARAEDEDARHAARIAYSCLKKQMAIVDAQLP